jgi:hypothetical protein
VSAPPAGRIPTEHERLLADQRDRWLRGDRILVESYQASQPTLSSDPERLLDLIYNEIDLRERLGERPGLDEYVRRFPHLELPLRDQFEIHRLLASNTGTVTMAEDRRARAVGVEEATARSGPANGQGPSPPGRGGPGDSRGLTPPGYEILCELGRGGMGVVYKARHVSLNRVVALKTILVGPHASVPQRARFRAEAEAAARLQHPNVVQVFDVGEHASCPFLAMEYVAGGSLASRLDGTPVPPRAAATLTRTLADAVHAAHRAGVIHRDLKPANVLIAGDGTPKITDFGLAKRFDAGDGHSATGDILGTPSYMSPEQAEGRVSEVSPATDVYALGSILYELLTGRPSFKAATPLETVRQVLAMEPVPLRRLQPDVPRDLETVCLKCLEKAPEKRYPSAEALAEDIRRFLAGAPVLARPGGLPERFARWCRRQPALAAAGGLAAVLVASLVTFSVAFGVQRTRAAERLRQERELASARFTLALGAVKDYHTGVSEDILLKQPEFKDLQARLLRAPQAFYERLRASLEAGGTTDREGREALAEACENLGDLTLRIGSPNDAEADYVQALAVRDAMARLS